MLDTPVEHLRARPDPSRWTTLEYAAHVRDVLRLYRTRLALMVDADDPLFANWDQDATARDERYNEQDPSVVALELQDAGAALADAFDAIDGDQWQRRGRRSDGASFTIATFAQYMIHDPIHHLWDVDAARLNPAMPKDRADRALTGTSATLFGFCGGEFRRDLEWRDGRGRARRGGVRVAGGDRGACRRR